MKRSFLEQCRAWTKKSFSAGQQEGLKRYSPFFLYAVVSLLVIALYVEQQDWLENLDMKIQDKMVQLGRQKGTPNRVAIVTIDDSAIDKIGEWPWDAERIGYLIGMLSEYEPAAIGLDFEFPSSGKFDPEGDAFLAQIIEQAGNVVVPLDFHISDRPLPGTNAPQYILKSSYIMADQEVEMLDHPTLQAHQLRAPSRAVSNASWNLGHVNSAVDRDGIVRADPVMIKFAGDYYPSMAVQLARAALDIHRAQVKVDPGNEIRLGHIPIPIDDQGRMLIEYWGGPRSFPTLSATRILEGKEPVERLKGKVVLVGVTASGYVGTLHTPVSPLMHRTERIANATESIMRKRFIAQLNVATVLELAILVGIGLFCGVVLPRITLQYRIIVLAVFLFVIVNMNYILYSSFHMVTKTLYPSLEILLFLLLSPAVKMRQTAIDSLQTEPAVKKQRRKKQPIQPRVMSVGKAGSGTPTDSSAPPHFRGQAISKDELAETQVLTEELLNQVREATNSQAAGDRTPQEHNSLQNISGVDTPIVATGAAEALAAGPPTPPQRGNGTPSSTPVVNADGMPQQLGRYEVIELVGQGAMGSVYRGKDPAIDRLVALKTIRFEYGKSEEELDELRERFYREARAAGRLSHPNIVTVYDVGSEGDLQYIAMEFLEGHTLVEIVKNKKALNYKIMAKIIMQVCSALDYAHKQGVVHRDIKPANIMVLKNFEVKVADFGIARLDQPNMTMTQTGMAMGTPNYIAPEQLKGEKVDARSDIFSLGVVIYELLTHKRPFAGENMSQLIYNILNVEPKKPSSIDEHIPGIFDMVTTRCLAKDPYDRYQNAGEIAADLVDFVSSFGEKAFKI